MKDVGWALPTIKKIGGYCPPYLTPPSKSWLLKEFDRNSWLRRQVQSVVSVSVAKWVRGYVNSNEISTCP